VNDEPRDEQQPESPEQPEAPEEPTPEEPTAEEPEAPAEQPDAPEEQPEEAPAEEPATPGEQPGSDEAPVAEQPEQPEPEQSEPAQSEPDKPEPDKPEEKAKKSEVAPGAELDPIAITDDREKLSTEERARLEAEEEERRRAEEAVTAEPVDEPIAAAVKPADLAKDARYTATGKRKSSVARVIIRPGGGTIEVNRRKFEEYFPRPQLQTIAKQALVQAGYEGTVDVQVRVHGGGVAGQASAVRHGIARALTEIDPNLRGELKKRGMLTRDARAKERRKAGLKKARKKPQFSKR
jgi:small subunit ribosomal protein S9